MIRSSTPLSQSVPLYHLVTEWRRSLMSGSNTRDTTRGGEAQAMSACKGLGGGIREFTELTSKSPATALLLQLYLPILGI